MRQPTADPFSWWRRALIDPSLPRHEEDPQAGFYRRRAVKGGPWLPIAITLRQNIDWRGELTEPEAFEAVEMGYRRDPYRVWMSCRPISEAEHEALIGRHQNIAAMAATHAPLDLAAHPITPGD